VTGLPPRRGFDWDAAGHALGESVSEYCALVVIGVDPVATGRVAVALARAQATKRRVAVGDLFAESPPIQELVHTDDPHGLVDSFLYGVSISRIAYEVPDSGQLFVMPSGTEPPDYEEMLPNPRWHRLAAGFREVGALLVLAAPASAPHIEDLVAATDGAILVGEGVPRSLPVALVVSTVREPRPETAPEPVGITKERPPRWSRRRVAAFAGVVLTLSLAGVAAWLAYRPFAETKRKHIGPPPDTTKGIQRVIAGASPDTAIRPPGSDTTSAPPVTISVPQVTNPQDSAQTAAFGVELMAANTQAGAILKLLQDGKKMPAATFSPFLDASGARWYKVISGAFAEQRGADSLAAELRRQKVVEAGGSVRRLPFAFLIDSAVKAEAVPGMIAAYADRQQPVYALRQANGTAWLLIGAFETPDQSGLYAESLRASGIIPVLVYRKGRMF
jgi:hypothetical protein